MYTLHNGDTHQTLAPQAVPGDLPVALNHIDQIICSCVGLADGHICIADAVFAEDSLDLIMIDVRQRDGGSDRNPTLVLFADGDRGWFLVQPNSKTL